MILFAPVRLGGFSEGACGSVNIPVGEQPELARFVECLAKAPPLSVDFCHPLCDPRPFARRVKTFESLPEVDQLGVIHSAPLMAAQCTDVASALLPLKAAGVLRPESPASRDYWQTSISAWAADDLEAKGFAGAVVSIGWPMPIKSALVQLLKQAYIETIEALPPIIHEAFRDGAIAHEPGSVLISADDELLPMGLRESVIAVPDFGLSPDTAMYAVQNAREHLLALRGGAI